MQFQPLISAQELQHFLLSSTAEKVLLVDVSYDLTDPLEGVRLYEQAHIPNAHFLSLSKNLCGILTGTNGRHPLPSQASFVASLHDIGMNQDTHVIVYDQQNCMFASHLWWMLLWVGHAKVQVLNGGLAAWKKAHGALTAKMPNITQRGNFEIHETLAPTVDANYILKHLKSTQLQLIDARAPERFRGDIEPLDPVAGHIPGAINRPFMDNLTPEGLYKLPTELKQEWDKLISAYPINTLAHHCGSGVSACHNILAMAHAGYPMTALYPGSWSEWCANPDFPTEQG